MIWLVLVRRQNLKHAEDVGAGFTLSKMFLFFSETQKKNLCLLTTKPFK